MEKLTQYKMSSEFCYHVARYYDLKALQWGIDHCRTHPYISAPIFYVLVCSIGPFIRSFKKQIRDLGGVLYVDPDGHEWMRKKWSVGNTNGSFWKKGIRLEDITLCIGFPALSDGRVHKILYGSVKAARA